MKPLLFINTLFSSPKCHLITWRVIWLDAPVFGNAVQLLHARVTRPFCGRPRGFAMIIITTQVSKVHSYIRIYPSQVKWLLSSSGATSVLGIPAYICWIGCWTKCLLFYLKMAPVSIWNTYNLGTVDCHEICPGVPSGNQTLSPSLRGLSVLALWWWSKFCFCLFLICLSFCFNWQVFVDSVGWFLLEQWYGACWWASKLMYGPSFFFNILVIVCTASSATLLLHGNLGLLVLWEKP